MYRVCTYSLEGTDGDCEHKDLKHRTGPFYLCNDCGATVMEDNTDLILQLRPQDTPLFKAKEVEDE